MSSYFRMHLDNEKRCTIEKRFKANQEGRTNTAMFSKKPSTSRQWPPFKNPRIVRVPRSSGSKDRHSKVSTIRGLRDRRIRLSVQTAIQLYELQDMLGFGQPSKVIDWLIEASKDDIDKLPPLPFTPQGISHLHQQMHTIASQGNSCFLANSGIKNDTNTSYDHSNIMPTWKFREMEASMKARNKNVDAALQENEIKQVSAQNLFPMSQYPSLPTALNNNVLMPYNNSFYHWEPPNLSLSEFQNHNDQNPYASSANALALQPSLAFPSGNQLLFCPPAGFLQCPPSITNSSESNRRQVFEPLQFLSSSSQQVLPLSLNVNPWFINLQNNADNSVKHGTGS